eukprot:COSAG05_NODE_215_length_13904_cov_87.085911_9_plen_417_part_00
MILLLKLLINGLLVSKVAIGEQVMGLAMQLLLIAAAAAASQRNPYCWSEDNTSQIYVFLALAAMASLKFSAVAKYESWTSITTLISVAIMAVTFLAVAYSAIRLLLAPKRAQEAARKRLEEDKFNKATNFGRAFRSTVNTVLAAQAIGRKPSLLLPSRIRDGNGSDEWIEQYSKQHGRTYYINKRTRESVWERPTSSACHDVTTPDAGTRVGTLESLSMQELKQLLLSSSPAATRKEYTDILADIHTHAEVLELCVSEGLSPCAVETPHASRRGETFDVDGNTDASTLTANQGAEHRLESNPVFQEGHEPHDYAAAPAHVPLDSPSLAASVSKQEYEESMAAARAAFLQYDIDSNGAMSKEEAMAMANDLGLRKSTEFIEGAWSVYDGNGDGVLSQTEFEHFFAALLVACTADRAQ